MWGTAAVRGRAAPCVCGVTTMTAYSTPPTSRTPATSKPSRASESSVPRPEMRTSAMRCWAAAGIGATAPATTRNARSRVVARAIREPADSRQGRARARSGRRPWAPKGPRRATTRAAISRASRSRGSSGGVLLRPRPRARATPPRGVARPRAALPARPRERLCRVPSRPARARPRRRARRAPRRRVPPRRARARRSPALRGCRRGAPTALPDVAPRPRDRAMAPARGREAASEYSCCRELRDLGGTAGAALVVGHEEGERFGEEAIARNTGRGDRALDGGGFTFDLHEHVHRGIPLDAHGRLGKPVFDDGSIDPHHHLVPQSGDDEGGGLGV